MELKQIASFQVDHRKLTEGMYTSRVDGDVTTYDIRMGRPNCGTYLGSTSSPPMSAAGRCRTG